MKLTTSPDQWGAAILLLVAAGTHVPLIREHLEEAPYVGVLFIALSVVCTALAAAMLFLERPALWMLSAVVCLAAVVAFLASRTVGLPQIHDDIGNWTEPLGFPALAAEAWVPVLAYLHLRERALTASPTPRQ
jgi:hypothetical protein